MGRTAKYLTRKERLEAQRKQRALRAQKPGAKAVRSAESRRAYLKRKGLTLIRTEVPQPDASIRRAAELGMSSQDYVNVFRQFRGGEGTLVLDGLDGEVDIDALAGMPPYPRCLVDLDTFFDDWDYIEAAMHGGMARRHLEQCEELIDLRRRLSDHELAIELHKRHKELTLEYQRFVDTHAHLDRFGQWQESDIALQNVKWKSRLLMYSWGDIEALKKGDGLFVHEVMERMWNIGKI
ncbi:hypothetical protein NMY22_g3012 [Coprinellus aureogranulatus]|nr:hypothetical protein NMY22_g3012 [Coprinellus aureogranulatus]